MNLIFRCFDEKLTFDVRVVDVRLQVLDELLQLFSVQRRRGRASVLLRLQLQLHLRDGSPPEVEGVEELLRLGRLLSSSLLCLTGVLRRTHAGCAGAAEGGDELTEGLERSLTHL